MELDCEELLVPIREENALRFSIVSRTTPILQYIRKISSLIGMSHILSFFDETDSFKIYFDDKRCVDYILRSHIHVMNHHVKVEYVLPPGRKIVLTDVDPIIPDANIVVSLSPYGSVVSPVIRPPVSDDVLLCHITNGIRYVYMTLNGDIPSLITLNYGDHYYSFQVNIDELFNVSSPIIKVDDSDSSCCEIQSVRSCAPNIVEPRAENDYVTPERSTINISSVGSLVQNKKKGPGRPRKNFCKKTTATSVAANKIKKNRYKFRSSREANYIDNDSLPEYSNQVQSDNFPPNLEVSEQSQGISPRFRYVKRKRGRYRRNFHWKSSASAAAHRIKKKSMPRLMSFQRKTQNNSDPVQSDASTEKYLELPDLEASSKDFVDEESLENNSNLPYNPPFDMQTLLRYLQEVKNRRIPLEITKKFLGESYSAESLNNLCQQLRIYNSHNHNNLSLKARVIRLIKTLKLFIMQDFKVVA